MGSEAEIAIFARDIREITRAEGLVARLASMLASLGFVAFNYGFGKKTEAGGMIADLIWSTLDPSWIGHYAENHYYRDDRLVRAAVLRLAAFTYEDVFCAAPRTARQQEMEQRFGYRSGVVVPMHGPGQAFGVLSAAAPDVAQPPPIGPLKMAAMQYIATTFHDHVLGLNLPKSPMALEIPPIALTFREKQCLTWASAGKTNQDIGDLLQISTRTAKKYVENAMAKLDASNRAQAVARALALGLIEG
jgi:DNA-binding CsgD family transcriptional regulator